MSKMFLITTSATEDVEAKSHEQAEVQIQPAPAIDEMDLGTLFTPLTQAEVARRLAALRAFETDTNTANSSNEKVNSSFDAVADSYDERVTQLMEGHK